ncbi:hypothetical protein KA977_03000, partial [Candidatus Dependentiae bacterium]|nr:hypothetical protein [Candidatus Dependentiae bacterium]
IVLNLFFADIGSAFTPISIIPPHLFEFDDKINNEMIDFSKIRSINYFDVELLYKQNYLYNQKQQKEETKIKLTESEADILFKPFGQYFFFTYSANNLKFEGKSASEKHNLSLKIKNKNYDIAGLGLITEYAEGYINKDINDDKNGFSNLIAGIGIKKYFNLTYFQTKKNEDITLDFSYKNENINVENKIFPENYGIKAYISFESLCKFTFFSRKSSLKDDIDKEEINNKFNTLNNGEGRDKIWSFYINISDKFNFEYKTEKHNSKFYTSIFEKSNIHSKIINVFAENEKQGKKLFINWHYSNNDTGNFIKAGISNCRASSYGSGYFDASYYIDFFLNVMSGDRTGYFNFEYDYYDIEIAWSKNFKKKWVIMPGITIYNFKKFKLFYEYYEPYLGGFLIRNRENKLKEYDRLILADLSVLVKYNFNFNTFLSMNMAQFAPITIKEKEFAENSSTRVSTISEHYEEYKKIRGGFRILCAIEYKY